MTHRVWVVAAAFVVACAALIGMRDLRVGLSLLIGGAWNVANLWCLVHLLNAWLGPRPSTRKALGWLLLKFPLLYVMAFGVLRTSAVSSVGFGIGFTIVLVIMISAFALHAKRTLLRSHGP